MNQRRLHSRVEDYFPREIIVEGDKYLDPNKISLVRWGELENLSYVKSLFPTFVKQVREYCFKQALKKGILSKEPDENFFIATEKNPEIEGSTLYFTSLDAILEYRVETKQKHKPIAKATLIC